MNEGEEACEREAPKVYPSITPEELEILTPLIRALAQLAAEQSARAERCEGNAGRVATAAAPSEGI